MATGQPRSQPTLKTASVFVKLPSNCPASHRTKLLMPSEVLVQSPSVQAQKLKPKGEKRHAPTLAAPKRMNKSPRLSYYHCGGERLSTDDIRVSLIELERLLFAMDRQSKEGFNETWHSLQFKLDRCFALWNAIEATVHSGTALPIAQKLSKERIDYLGSKVFELSSKYTAAIAARKEGDSSDSLIHKIFRARSFHRAASIDLERGPAGDESNSEGSDETASVDPLVGETTRVPSVSTVSPKTRVSQPSVADLQKMQREQVEMAISQMASQLKDETARINETLRGQTDGLDDLEDVAADNVQKVSDVAKDVEEHVQSSWNRNFGTWTLFFTIVGAFLFVLVIIQMAPKGKGCIFFCETKPRPDEFCRTLPSGRRECIRLDDADRPDLQSQPESSTDKKASSTTAESIKQQEEVVKRNKPLEDSHQSELRENCELNEFGECLDESNDRENERAFADGNSLTKAEIEEAMNDPFFSSDTTDNVVEGKRPIYNRKHFSPRDIRNAANLGDYYLMEAYLTIKPEWVDKADQNGWTALHLSARRGDLRAVNYLKRIGADFSSTTRDGRTPRDIALSYHKDGHPIVTAMEL